MKKVYGEELLEKVLSRKKRAQEAIDNRWERIYNCEVEMDDCFISQHLEEDTIRECDMQIAILKGDGCMDMKAVFDENGNEVRIHYFQNKWGKTSCVGNGIFASSMSALLKKTGWTEKIIRVPAWTKWVCYGNGKGLAGVLNGGTEMVRWHTNMKTGEYVGYPD